MELQRPNAKKVVSAADKELLEQYGAAVVECSWVRIKEVPWGKIGGKCERLCEVYSLSRLVCIVDELQQCHIWLPLIQ